MAMPKRTNFPKMTPDYLRSIIDYDSNSGEMRWKIKRTHSFIGQKVGIIRKYDGYLQTRIDRKMYLVHRLVWFYVYGRWPRKFVDHKNRNPIDNRINNLRECNHSQNGFNRPAQSNNKLGLKGVHKVFWSGGVVKYKAQVYITKNNIKQTIYLGCFNSPKIAHRAYKKKARELHKEFYYV